jgi:hypothetical protein
MLPLLKRLADGGEHKFFGLVADLGSDFGLTEEELSERNAADLRKSRRMGQGCI